MRLRKRDLQTVWLKERIITKGSTGKETITYSDEPIEIKMNIQSAKGLVMAQIYGNKLSSVKSCMYQGDEINEGKQEKWGICYNVDKLSKPDYEIAAIQPFSTHKNVTLERL